MKDNSVPVQVTSDPIDVLFSPVSVAIVGASADESKFGGRVMRNLLRYGYDGRIFPVNRKGDPILGIPGYVSVSDIPGEIDLAVIAVPGSVVPSVLEECAKKAAKAAVIVSSGFAELGADGAVEQGNLVALARRLGIRLMGPNSLGVYHAGNRLAATANQAFDRSFEPGDVALLSQSGAIGGSLLDAGMDQGLRFSSFVSMGNSADLEIADLIPNQVDDPTCRTILLYIEGVRDFEKLATGLELARRAGKPVIVLRAGWSRKGASAIQSHTGSLAGSTAAYRAILRKYGAIVVYDLQEALDASKAASAMTRLGSRLGFISVSGGMGGLAADRCDEFGLTLAEFSESTRVELREMLPSFAPDENPLDVTGAITSSAGLMEQVLRCVAEDENTDVLVILITVVYGSERIATEIARARPDIDKPILVVVSGGETVRSTRETLAAAAVPLFHDLRGGMQAISRLLSISAEIQGGEVDRVERGLSPDAMTRINRILTESTTGSPHGAMLNESRSKEILQLSGVSVCPEVLVHTVQEALEAGREFSFPLVLKGLTSQIGHKAKSGLVKLNICNEEHLEKAFEEIHESARKVDTELEGVLVQPMLSPGIELLVGGIRDPQVGPLVAFGLGGAFTEELAQITFRPAPLTESEALEMIADIPGCRKLSDRAKNGTGCITDVLTGVSTLISRNPAIQELDINPLIYYPDENRAIAVDGLIRCNGSIDQQ